MNGRCGLRSRFASESTSFVLTVNLDLEFANFTLQVTTVQDMCNRIFILKLDLDSDLDLDLHIGFVSINVLIQLIFSAEVVEGLDKVCPLLYIHSFKTFQE